MKCITFLSLALSILFLAACGPSTAQLLGDYDIGVLTCDDCASDANLFASERGNKNINCSVKWGTPVRVSEDRDGERVFVKDPMVNNCHGYVSLDSVTFH